MPKTYSLYFYLILKMAETSRYIYSRTLPKLVIMIATFSYMMFRIMMMIKLMREAVMDVAICGVRYFWIGSVPLRFLGSFAENTMNTESL